MLKTTASIPDLKAPFPWFGGKSRVADLVWSRFGDTPNYVEPFFGSGAVLLGRPTDHAGYIETANDKDGFIANAWRAIKLDPKGVAEHADNPVNENDLHARHVWLLSRRDSLASQLEGDPEYFDPKIAGWWIWGICCWIGSGWCSGKGPWKTEDGSLVNTSQRPHLGNAGQGVNRQRPHLGDAGRGERIYEYMHSLSERLAGVRVCCGDWRRVLGDSPTTKLGITAVFLDPPYADTAERTTDLYAEDSLSIAHDVRRWAIEHQDDPKLRIALCGYEGEHVMPVSWECVPWKAHGGYGNQGQIVGRANAKRERVWFSPACLKLKDAKNTLFT